MQQGNIQPRTVLVLVSGVTNNLYLKSALARCVTGFEFVIPLCSSFVGLLRLVRTRRLISPDFLCSLMVPWQTFESRCPR